MIALAVAAVGILGAVIAYVFEQRTDRRENLRQQFADALADIYRWTELPYRIRRRSPTARSRYHVAA